MEQIKDKIITGFGCRKTFKGESDFDKFYIDRVVKPVAQKVGDGEDDFVIVEKVIETKKDIKEVINSQNDEAGLDAYLKPYLMSGTMPDVHLSDEVVDYSKMPETMDDIVDFANLSLSKFATLPDDLVKGRTFGEFMSSITQDEFNNYFASKQKKILKKPIKKEESKKEGDIEK